MRKPRGEQPMTPAERAEQRRARLASQGMTPVTVPLRAELWEEWERRAGELPGSLSRVERLNAVLEYLLHNVAARYEYNQNAPVPASEPPAVDLLADDPVHRVTLLYNRIDQIEEERRQIEEQELPAARIAADAAVAARKATAGPPAPEREVCDAAPAPEPATAPSAPAPEPPAPAPTTAPARKAPAAVTCEPPAAAWGSPEMDAWVADQMWAKVPAKAIAAALASIGITSPSPKNPGQPYSDNAIGAARNRHYDRKHQRSAG